MAARTQTMNDVLRALPSIDSLLRTTTAQALQPAVGAERLSILARRVTDELRQEILAGSAGSNAVSLDGGIYSRGALLEEAERRLITAHQRETISSLRRVINATGV